MRCPSWELSEATEPSIFTLLLVCYLTAGVTESAHVCHTELHMSMRIRAVRRYVLPTCQNQLSVTGCSYVSSRVLTSNYLVLPTYRLQLLASVMCVGSPSLLQRHARLSPRFPSPKVDGVDRFAPLLEDRNELRVRWYPGD